MPQSKWREFYIIRRLSHSWLLCNGVGAGKRTEKKGSKVRRTGDRQKVGESCKVWPSHMFIHSTLTGPATVNAKGHGNPTSIALRTTRNYLWLALGRKTRMPDTHTLYIYCDTCGWEYHPRCVGLDLSIYLPIRLNPWGDIRYIYIRQYRFQMPKLQFELQST